ncbi:MAG: double-strand break repair helicase AddA [Alphaproteobacteria bacterium]|nr:double-strand break repair helicase AddA [Alphaproteobacteria bacterium]
MKTPSELQNEASDPKVSAWVAASAGSGKTKVLTDRVLRLLLAGNNPSKILCLTYTRNAAAEMQNRIAKKLSDWAIISDEELSEQLKKIDSDDENSRIEARKLFAKMLDTPDGLKIMTIHSFCQSLLKRFPVEAHVSPEFQVMDEIKTADLIEQAKTTILNDTAISETLDLIANYCSEENFNKTINEITGHLPDFIRFFDLYPENQRRFLYEQAFSLPKNATLESLSTDFLNKTDLEKMKDCIETLQLSQKKSSQERGNVLKQAFFEQKESILEFGKQAFLTKEGKKTAESRIVTNDVSEIKPYLLAEQEKFFEFYQQCKSLDLIKVNLDLLKIGEVLCKKYIELKNVNSQMDYDDLIHKTLDLLKNKDSVDWVMYKLDKGIDHLLVDEAQDTSPVQWKIIQALTSEFFSGNSAKENHRTLFVVGDKKQSIYSFQGAEPNEFANMQKYFQDKVEQACFTWRNVPMNTSFRSAPVIITAVNNLLKNPEMQSGVVDINQDYKHFAFREKEGGCVEIFKPFISEKQTENDIYEAPIKKQQTKKISMVQAAEAIAEKIKDLLEQENRLPNGKRICPRDIMVLVRRRNNFVEALTRELKAKNIPVSGSDRLCITQHIAVEDLMSLGDFVLLPSDNLTLATVLRSPLCNLTESELYDICIDRKQPLYYALKDKATENPKYNQVFQFLTTMLNKVGTCSPFEFYSYVLQLKMKDFIARLGIQVIDPLEEFLNKALEYDYDNMPSLQLFLRDLRSQESYIKRDFESGINEVRIMTVHASKGMEAPIVFLPDTCRFTYQRDIIQWTENLPIWLPAASYATKYSDEVNLKNRQKSIEEYHRLLYVAVTRASDQLYIYGYAGTKGKSKECWYDLLKQMFKPEDIDEDEHGIYIEQMEQAHEPLEENVSRESNEASLPDWTQKNAPKDDPLSKPLSPSKQENETQYQSPLKVDNPATKRGTLIHKMLEVLPNYEGEEQIEAAQKLLKLYRYDGDENLVEYVLKILRDKQFYPLFTPQSQSEVPITGITDSNQVVSGVIDRLAVSETEVLIVDYKSNQKVPAPGNLPSGYVKQVSLYAELVQKIYPDKKIRPFILWTDEARLDEVFL